MMPLRAGSEARRNVGVVGAGPAGWSIAAACAEAGLTVVLVDPRLDEPLANTYGLWVDEPELPPECLARTWSGPLVYSDVDGERVLDRTYGLIDNAALVGWLRQRLEAAGGEARVGQVERVEAGPEGARLEIEGVPLEVDVVIDCTGFAQRFLDTPTDRDAPVAWQTAYGVVAEVSDVPWGEERMVLMDYRTVRGATGVPSFLYVLPLDDGRMLLEETVLAAVPEVSEEVLAGRLDARLSQLGITVGHVHNVEIVRIPMDRRPPRIPQAVVGFGAAAGFVHPATGYSIARSFTQAPTVARALAEGLAEGGPALASERAWQTIHPPTLQRSTRLARSGLKALLPLGSTAIGQFMHHFFGMPKTCWTAFLSGTASAGGMAGAMFRLGPHLPVALVARVTAAVLGPGFADFAYGLTGIEFDPPSRREDWRGVAMALGLFGAWFVTLVTLLLVPLEGVMWAVAPFAVLWLTWLFTGLFITAHDAMHGSVAPGRTGLNHAIGTVALLAYAMMDYHALRRAHGHHHATPARDGDPDWHDGHDPRVGPWFWAFMLRYLTWGQWIRLVFVFWTLYLLVPTENLLLFWALPSIMSTFQLFYFGTYLPHSEPEGGHHNEHHAYSNSYSDLVSLVTCFHFGGCHLEHHLQPSVPWWGLASVRARRRAEAS